MKQELATSVYALVPSRGLGGGIESYVRASLEALEANGAQVIEMPLQTPEQPLSLRRKAEFAVEVIQKAQANRKQGPTLIIAFHPSFARVASIARRVAGPRTRGFVVYHALDLVQGGVRPPRGLSLVAVSTFTAGMLARYGNAAVLHAGIPRARYERLMAGPVRAEPGDEHRVLSVFQLSSFVGKGGPCIIEACERLRADGRPITLTFAGHGHAAPELSAASAGRDWIRVHESPTDSDLDALFREVELFVLATRSRYREGTSGEGLGLVLIEASLAGLPLVAPAYGGSADAFVEGLTGLKPSDESPEALGVTIAWAFDHPEETERMAASARVWASAAFGPEAHSASAAELFLGGAPRHAFWGVDIHPVRT